MSTKSFIWLAVGSFLLVMILIFIAGFVGVNNHTIELEEKITESDQNITINKNKAVTQLDLLVEAIDSSNALYQRVLDSITAARESDYSTASVTSAIDIIVEAYPGDMANQTLYKGYMDAAVNATEELFRYRKLYNKDTKEYRVYTRRFPNSIYLNIMGYSRITYPELEFDNSDSPL